MTPLTHGPIFISFEGIDGSGKSTQSRLLAAHLRDRGFDVLHTREPGGSPGAEEIRALVLTGDPGRWSPETEILLFTAARRDHLERTIRPALAAGRVVICDRFADSTRMYQGATRGDLRALVDRLHDLMIGLEPDLTFVIDMDPARALARGLARVGAEQRFEDMGLPMQETLRHGFLRLARDYPERCIVIDGDRDAPAVASEIAAHALDRMPDPIAGQSSGPISGPISGQNTSQIAGQSSGQVSGQGSGQGSGQIADPIAGQIPDRNPGRPDHA